MNKDLNKQISIYKNDIDEVLINDKTIIYRFLDLHKQNLIKGLSSKINCKFYGGFLNSEYNRCIISNYEITTNMFDIIIYRINTDSKYLTLTHKNILGTLLSLGIKRDSIGDIIVIDNIGYFACTLEISKYILENFTNINSSNIKLTIEENINIDYSINYKKKIYIVSSMRLDVLIKAVYNFSREEAKEYILTNNVKVNQVYCLDYSKIINTEDLISVHKYGRFKVFNILGKTIKDKIKVEIGKV